jgi:hypothetical protein
LILSPVLVLVGTVWFLVATWGLKRLGRLEFRFLMLLLFVVSVLLGAYLAFQGLGPTWFKAFATFGLGGFICLALGGCVWWQLRPVA